MSVLGELAAELASVVHAIGDARLVARRALRGVDEALGRFAQATEGSHRRLVRDVTTAWTRAGQRVAGAAEDMSAGSGAVLDYLRAIGAGP